MPIYGEGKTTYTDADSLSDDYPKQLHAHARVFYELAQIYFQCLCGVEKSP